jgi:hypothetical protein
MDPNKRRLTIPFNGGSITGSLGLLEFLFGERLVAEQLGKKTAVTRRAHSRRRVIGGDSSSVAGAEYELTSYGARGSSQASGGEPVRVLADGDWWTLRLVGSHEAFDKFLKRGGFAGGKIVLWQSEKGTDYGPYVSAEEPAVPVA